MPAWRSRPCQRSDPNRLADRSVDAAERAADLTRQMLAYAGKGEFVIEPMDLSQRYRNQALWCNAAMPKQVNVTMQLATDLPPVDADPAGPAAHHEPGDQRRRSHRSG